MKIRLKVLDAQYLFAEDYIENLNTKELVPKMVFRRRLTRSAKLVIELMSRIESKDNRIVYGISFGELLSSSKILNAILKKDILSPSDFQNSVYNTAVSYASILFKNEKEVTTISSGDETSLKVLKVGAVKSLDEDELLLICCETLNIDNISEVNKCIKYLESIVILKVKMTEDKPTIKLSNLKNDGFSKSVEHMMYIAKKFSHKNENIVEIEI